MMHATIDILKTTHQGTILLAFIFPINQRIERPHRVPEAEESTLLALVHVLQLFLVGVDQGVHEPPGGDVVEVSPRAPSP